MQTKFLIEAKIEMIHEINSLDIAKPSIIISLPSKTIFMYPRENWYRMRKSKNRKHSIRRILRAARKGCFVRIQAPGIIFYRQKITLIKDDLEMMLGDERKELTKEIYETLNTRIYI